MAFRQALGYLYIYFWIKRARLHARLQRLNRYRRYVYWILIINMFYLAAEIVVTKFGLGALGQPFWVQFGFAVVYAVVLIHLIYEASEEAQHYYFTEAARATSEALMFEQDPQAVVSRVLALALENFSKRGAMNANLALLEGAHLRIRPNLCIGQLYDAALPIDKGCAGLAFSKRHTVYLPSWKHRHAILAMLDGDETEFGLERDAYVELQGVPENFVSVMCIPLIAGGSVLGVLNIDSLKAAAFRQLDLEHGRFFAAVMALYMQHKGGHLS